MAFGLHYAVFATSHETGKGPVLNENVVAVTAGALESDVMDVNAGNKSRSVRITADTNCWVHWGENPTALSDGTAGRPMGPDISTDEYFDILANWKISVIQRT